MELDRPRVVDGRGRVRWTMTRAGGADLLVLPAAVGGRGTPSVFDGPELGDGELPVGLRLVSAQPLDDGSVRLHYEVA